MCVELIVLCCSNYNLFIIAPVFVAPLKRCLQTLECTKSTQKRYLLNLLLRPVFRKFNNSKTELAAHRLNPAIDPPSINHIHINTRQPFNNNPTKPSHFCSAPRTKRDCESISHEHLSVHLPPSRGTFSLLEQNGRAAGGVPQGTRYGPPESRAKSRQRRNSAAAESRE